ncbi:biotin transporter BioY [Wenxinia saemankumensis]|uniref:Biotin transporter n=1 Tax=Wenxinia saemankumensis TaxID=1447782 RepID=A0A1M6EY62_9RHOB|nr:biotin transporter BioY [Wenxinia saemankumensis]SHI90336.1 biotin transport system substrate-specific component [Wenxinia saemankumensis]
MAATMNRDVLIDRIGGTGEGAALLRKVVLVALGVAFMAAAAKIRVPMWPVPITMQTFAVLSLGAAYGARMGLATLIAYLALGAAGVPLFTGSEAGLAYLVGPTGGYLVGFAVAAFAVGALARRGWSRSVGGMVGALLVGNAIIYAFGLPWMAWLFAAERGWGFVWTWGIGNFLIGDALKLALAAVALPAAWKMLDRR